MLVLDIATKTFAPESVFKPAVQAEAVPETILLTPTNVPDPVYFRTYGEATAVVNDFPEPTGVAAKEFTVTVWGEKLDAK